MSTLSDIKSIALAGLIVIGLMVQGKPAVAAETQTLTVAGGCFWCVEADFEDLPGVTNAVSGFAGGKSADPTYSEVTGNNTGHFEAVQITFDPSVVTAPELLHLFFRSIDPTDAGGQFCDRGPSYRTAVFATDDQTAAAKAAKAQAQADLGQTVVTPILSAGAFYPADDYHQDFAKGKRLVVTRSGPRSQAKAYKAYREACGRDARIKELWGDAAPFAS